MPDTTPVPPTTDPDLSTVLVSSIAKLELQPDDVLAITLGRHPTSSEYERLARNVREAMTNRVLILLPGSGLTVITREHLDDDLTRAAL